MEPSKPFASTNRIIDASLLRLLRFQIVARFKKARSAFSTPRRRIMTCIGILLGLVWLGQSILSVIFRQPADPERLAIWIPLGLFVYSAWHIIKTISVKPEEPFDWTPAEREFLIGAPLTRLQLISYRFVSIILSAVSKAICFSLLMMPDLNFMFAGFIGMTLGLLLIDLFRILVEVICFGLSKRQLMVSRLVVYTVLVGWVGSTIVSALFSATGAANLASPASLLFAKQVIFDLVAQIEANQFWILAPFRPAASVVLTSAIGWNLIVNAGTAFTIVVMAGVLVIKIERRVWKIRSNREAKRTDRLISRYVAREPTANLTKQNQGFLTSLARRVGLKLPFRFRGAFSIARRQLLGAWHYRGTLLVSLGLPVMLCCLPLLAHDDPLPTLFNVMGGLVFYSFLLLPAALMLDFRRDIHRMDVLKSLPISPLSVTVGQLFAPVALCMLFHWIVLTIAWLTGAITIGMVLVGGMLLIPIGVLIFATENLIFMMSPYRRNQEGFSVFVRTILTFTAKGLMFGFGLVAVLLWAFASRFLADISGVGEASKIVFGAGLWIFVAALAAVATCLLSKRYQQFDPSFDMPAET